MQSLGKMLVLLGVGLVMIGGLLVLLGRARYGSIPGDLRFQGDGWSCFVPIGTSLLVSLVLSIVLTLLWRFFGR